MGLLRKTIVLVPIGMLLGILAAWVITIIGGTALGLIKGVGYVISGDSSSILYETVTMGALLGGILGIVYAPFCGGVIGTSVTIQSIFFGFRSVAKVHSILLYIFLAIIIIGGEHWVFKNTSILVNRNDAKNVVDTFGQALVEKTPGRAKALANPDLWQEIEIWMDGQEEFECPLTLLFENGPYAYGGQFGDPFHYRCYNGEDYELNIKEIRLEQIEGKWQVAGWGQVCETWGRKNIHRCSR